MVENENSFVFLSNSYVFVVKPDNSLSQVFTTQAGYLDSCYVRLYDNYTESNTPYTYRT